MKKILFFVLAGSCTTGAIAQTSTSMTTVVNAPAVTRLPALDKSPMDMAYYPVNYPVLKIQNKVSEPLMARIIYSRPLKNGRSVFASSNRDETVFRYVA